MSLQRGDLIFKRSIHLQEILMATNHLGYVSFINNNFDKNIKNYFTKLSNTNFSNIILVDSNLLNLKILIHLLINLNYPLIKFL